MAKQVRVLLASVGVVLHALKSELWQSRRAARQQRLVGLLALKSELWQSDAADPQTVGEGLLALKSELWQSILKLNLYTLKVCSH